MADLPNPGRVTTVLFADVSDSTTLYEAAGDRDAIEAIAGCIAALRKATEAAGGRVVKTMGDGLMALFATPDQAADASGRMHVAVRALPEVEGHKLAVRVGFHAGPVIQRNDDVFGDTVNLASRLAEQAVKGQVLTSADTVSLLTPAVRTATRRLYEIPVKGKSSDVALCELLWNKSPDITHAPVSAPLTQAAVSCLRLRYRGKELVLRRRVELILFGRDPACSFVVSDPCASRQHCVIERRQGEFSVRDHSSNGTYLCVDGEEGETVLRRSEVTLRGHGRLAFGQPVWQSSDVVEYWCE